MSAIFDSIQVSDEVKRFVDHSFDLANKIHELLEKQGKTQRDLANLMGKKESEISKWMQGTHNFTLKSLAKIEAVLGEHLLCILKKDEVVVKKQDIIFYQTFLQQQLKLKTRAIINQRTTVSVAFKEVPSELTLLNKSKIVVDETSYPMAA